MIKEAIAKVVDGNSLTMDEAAAVMNEIMSGEVTPSQFGAFVTALRIKGETVDEIAGLAKVMREKAIPVKSQGPLIDVVGTGGDSFNTFNITTTTAFIAAGAGLKVAKHGNRAMSSKCGSADVLEALGVKINLTAEQVQDSLDKVGIGFMFAQSFHPSMKYAAPLRPEIGIRTVFNILGPLTNPAGATTYLLGVADASLVNKLAMALQNLNCHHALVVHSEDGLDEISIAGNTQVCEIESGSIKNYMINPENLGFSLSGLDSIKGGTVEENATLLRNILSGTQTGPQKDVVLVNAAAALFAGDKVDNLQQGVELARETINNGNALARLEQLVELSKSYV
jgi:anthranilate phosphoribosyltransferase